jgi:bacterioferritin
MATPTLDRGILSQDHQAKRDELIDLLKRAYWMEIETVMSYIANSTNPDGVGQRRIPDWSRGQ